MKFFQAAIIAALAVPTAAINEPIASPTAAINDNEPIVSPTAAIEHDDAQIDRDRELENESQITVALSEASIQESIQENPDVVLVQQLQLAESQVRPMLMPCQFLSKEAITTRAFEAEANQDAQKGFGVNYVSDPENVEDAPVMHSARRFYYLDPCQGVLSNEGEAIGSRPNEEQGLGAVALEQVNGEGTELKELVVYKNNKGEVIEKVEFFVEENEDVIENEGSQQQDEAPILQRQREPEVATTMTSNAKTSKSPSPASTKTSKEPKAATMVVEGGAIVEGAIAEADKTKIEDLIDWEAFEAGVRQKQTTVSEEDGN